MFSTLLIDSSRVTTAFELTGYRVTENFGVARGIVARSRSVFGTFGAGIQVIFGGDITLFTTLCERAREDAYERMVSHAALLGANAVIGVRFDATDMGRGVTEFVAYGSAVRVEAKGI